MKRLGLIVNPVAGLGGRVGLKGSDGLDIQRQALALGAVPRAEDRAQIALEQLQPVQCELELFTYPAEMGESAAREAGFEPTVLGQIESGHTTPADTRQAAQAMLARGVDLLLFAGGDGTARDIYRALGDRLPVLGIPAGVKIHSAAFAAHPRSAGELALNYLCGRAGRLREAEVMDLDEAAYRQGQVSAELYGYLQIPFERRLVQGSKLPSSPSEEIVQETIAADVVDKMLFGWLYIIGPGTTTRAILDRLELPKSLIGVDVVLDRQLVAADVNESQLLTLLESGRPAKIVVTPIGGQGCLLGRGNQQISPQVIQRVGKENLVVVCTAGKLASFRNRPLFVDTGDPAVDQMLSGHIRIVTGYNEQTIYRVL